MLSRVVKRKSLWRRKYVRRVEPPSTLTLFATWPFGHCATVMLAVHFRRVHLARVSGESCPRRDWASATLCTLAESYQFWRMTRGDSQARRRTL